MDPRLLRAYSRELQFVREMGADFAREFPKIAGRLGMDGFDVSDPYVERLLEGFAFLSGRIQMKLDDEFPRFSQHLLEMVYPHYLSPTPSMAVVQMRPNLREGALLDGVQVPRDTVLRSSIGKDEQTPCIYRTSHPTTLWPLEIVRVDYRRNLGDLMDLRLPSVSRSKAVLRIRIKAAGIRLDRIALDKLTFFLRGGGEVTTRLYEQLLGHTTVAFGRPVDKGGEWSALSANPLLVPVGLQDNEALLPFGPRSFQGYRLLHEYFAFPQRFLFVELRGLAPAIRACSSEELELFILFDNQDPILESAVDSSHLVLFCTPAINLFPRRADRIHLTESQFEVHVVADRTRPMDFEVHSVLDVVGHGTGITRKFTPFYACTEQGTDEDGFYTLHRAPRKLSDRQRATGTRSSYIGSEVFLSLVDGEEGPFHSQLKQLAMETLCTNRDLPLHMPVGQGTTDFTLETGVPVESIRCVAGPTPPRPSHAHGDTTWRLISHLALNYLSLTDSGDGKGAGALRELLALYAEFGEATVRKEIDSVVSAVSQPIIRHLPVEGRPAFGRGVEVTVTCDETGFPGGGVVLFGAVLERFFAKYVSINSFTETVIRTVQRGEVMRWIPRIGQTHVV